MDEALVEFVRSQFASPAVFISMDDATASITLNGKTETENGTAIVGSFMMD